jgi:hypothetical protein
VPRLEPTQLVLLAAAALIAGAVNAVAGGGSLLSFPALLAAGFPTLTADVTNSVALTPGYLGGTAGYRRELAGQRSRTAVDMGALGSTSPAWSRLAYCQCPGAAGRGHLRRQLRLAVRPGVSKVVLYLKHL